MLLRLAYTHSLVEIAAALANPVPRRHLLPSPGGADLQPGLLRLTTSSLSKEIGRMLRRTTLACKETLPVEELSQRAAFDNPEAKPEYLLHREDGFVP